MPLPGSRLVFKPTTIRSAVIAALCAATLSAPAVAETPQAVDVPAGELTAALQTLATQVDAELMFRSEELVGVRTQGVRGTLLPSEAIQQLLKGTDLKIIVDPDGAVLIGKEPQLSARPRQSSRAPTANLTTGGIRVAQAPTVEAESAAAPRREVIEEITVRGRPFTDANVDIVRTEHDAQPYYIYRGEEIAEASAVTLEDFLKQKLTMNTVGRTQSNFSFLGNATSTVNLRGLGTDQTLILVNGRRTGGSNDEQFDLNALAPSMIERLEVLPSSASAIYGGSAVGGVINVILKRDFVGGHAQMSYDTPLDKHAPVRALSAGYGWSLEDGRTHITLSTAYRDSESLQLKDRPEFLRGHRYILERAPALIYSETSPAWFGATPNIASADGSPLTFKEAGPLAGTSLGSSLTYIPAGTSASTSLAQLQAGLLNNAGLQNTQHPDTNVWGVIPGLRRSFEPETEVVSVAGAARRKMTERLELITEVFFNSNEGRTSVGPDIFPFVPASAPTNPFQQDVFVFTPVSDGFGLATSKRESLRAVAGFVLDLPYDWRAQGDYTWNRTESPLLHEAFDYVSGGSASAAAFADGSLNPFVDVLANGLDSFAPYTTPNDRFTRKPVNTLRDIGLRVSGPVGRLPAGDPNLTIGLGHREEKQNGYVLDRAGYGRYSFLPVSQRVASVYMEAQVPLIAPANAIPGVRLLDVQLATRREDFSVDTGTPFRVTLPPDYAADPDETVLREKVDYAVTTTTAGLRYKPIDSLTLRASHATAFLPPSFSQLLPNPEQILGVSTGTFGDPRRGNELIIGASLLTGGNPDLDPMDAETLNVGLLFEPTFLPGLRAGLEWFRIKREDLIYAPDSLFMLANEEVFADRITRAQPAPGDPYGVGPVTQIDARVVNINYVSMEGFDISLGYRYASRNRGVFSIDLLATVIDEFTQAITPISPQQDVAGDVNGSGGPLKLRANATLGWERGPWSFNWTALYYGPYDQWNDPLIIAAQGSTTIPHQVYHDVLASYHFGDERGSGAGSMLNGVDVSLGVRNVFNEVPPMDVAWYTDANASPFGDYRLRSVRLSIAKRFN